jgi:hypothetical protein
MSSAAAAATHSPEMPADDPRMKGPVTASVMFHIAVAAFCIIGIPYIHRDLPLPEEPLSVELAKPDEVNQINKPQTHARNQPPQQIEKPPPVPPQIVDKAPPKPVAPEKPPEITPAVQPPDEAALPKKPPKPVHPPKPPAKKPPPKEKAVDQQQAFNSVLKNLIANPSTSASHDDTPDKADKSTQGKAAQQMTSSEYAALSHQLEGCWSIIAGARYAEDLVVDVKIYVNPDRTVRSKEVVDQVRYNSDSYFRAAADSALRAVEDPHCNPLELPPDKYEQWKAITFTFDPKQML